MEDKKLFLLDAYALIYRAYYALIRAPRFTSGGFNTSAVFGFCNTLDELLRKENPDYIAVCFDPHGPTFRHEAYDAYKAGREAQPEDITRSIPVIKEIIEAYNIPIFEIPGYEADDVIGTISLMASRRGFTTYMMTPDKDYGQLVSDNVFMYRPSLRGEGFEIRGVKEVCEKYGISTPLQVIDLLALEGDTADNIPGCPGVGPKTAAKLIAEYGSVENMLDNAHLIKGAIGKKITENAEGIRFSKMLATIKRDVPMEVDFDTLRREPENVGKLLEIFTRLEFKSFVAKLSRSAGLPPQAKAADPAPAAAPQPAELGLFDFIEGDDPADTAIAADTAPREIQTDYLPLSDITEIGNLISGAAAADAVGIAIYAIGAEAMTASLKAIAVSTAPGIARFIAIPSDDSRRRELLQLLEPLFSSSATLISHDIKRDMVILRRHGIAVTAPYFDTSLAHYVLQPEMRHRLTDVALSVLQYHTADFGDDAAARKPFAPLPAGEEVTRLCEQADIVMRLREPLTGLLERNGQLKLLTEIELPLARVLADMEWTGVRIDPAVLSDMSKALTEKLDSIDAKAYELAGEKFNIASPMQVGEILFGKMQLDPKAKRTKKGGYSTTEEILEKYLSLIHI